MHKKTVRVPIIVAKDCKICHSAKQWLREVGHDNDIEIELEELDCETSAKAIDLAIQYNLDDVPSFVIGEKGFCGMDFDYKEVVTALTDAKEST